MKLPQKVILPFPRGNSCRFRFRIITVTVSCWSGNCFSVVIGMFRLLTVCDTKSMILVMIHYAVRAINDLGHYVDYRVIKRGDSYVSQFLLENDNRWAHFHTHYTLDHAIARIMLTISAFKTQGNTIKE